MRIATSYHDFDVYIDVRSPSEYAHSHIPNAYNIPVLNDNQFKFIGTLYKKNTMQAQIIGASLACENIAAILKKITQEKTMQDIFQHKNKILIYCARGGKRSQALYEVLNNLNFQVYKLQEGYKGYRNEILKELEASYSFITLCGPTGCGKSELLQNLSPYSIDLENLAHHYGSSFGHLATQKLGDQPTQKMFENILAKALYNKKNIPLFIEAESKKIGNLIIPAQIFTQYQNTTKILITAPLQQRIERIIKLYHPIQEQDFLQAMQKIKPYISNKIFQSVITSWKQNQLHNVAELLITQYYDKVYKKSTYHHHIYNDNIEKSIQQLQDIAKSTSVFKY